MDKIKFGNGKEYDVVSYFFSDNTTLNFYILFEKDTFDFQSVQDMLTDKANTDNITIVSQDGLNINYYSGFTKLAQLSVELQNADSLTPDYYNTEIVLKKPDLQEQINEISQKVNNEIDINTITVDEYKAYRQNENNALLKQFLDNSSVTFKDGGKYGVSEEDQNEMAMNLEAYQLYVQLGIEAHLEWHEKKKECKEFTFSDFTELIVAVKNFVYPYIQYCQSKKAEIYSATSKAEITAIVIDYDSVVTKPIQE